MDKWYRLLHDGAKVFDLQQLAHRAQGVPRVFDSQQLDRGARPGEIGGPPATAVNSTPRPAAAAAIG